MSSTNVITNFFWRFLERCGAQGVTFIVSIVLARLLDPTVYGTVALVTIFYNDHAGLCGQRNGKCANPEKGCG